MCVCFRLKYYILYSVEWRFELCSLSDLVVVDKDKFYFTNYKKYHYDVRIDFVLGLRHGSVGYYNGSHADLVEEDLFAPSGIALSTDKK